MEQTQFLKFGPWMPDRSEFNTPGIETALNVIRTSNGYRPFSSLVESGFATLVDGQPTGLFFGKTVAGNARQFAAVFNATTLTTGMYEAGVGGGSWDRVGTWDVTTSNRFHTAQESDTLYITNYSEGLRSMVLGSGTDFDPINFVEGGQVKPKFLAIVKDFLVGCDNDDPANEVPNRCRWSAINDFDTWSLNGDPENLSGFQDLPDAGEFRGITGGEFGTLVFERGIFRMDFTGPPATWSFNRVENARGCETANSVVTEGQNTYYVAEDGWVKFDGQAVTPIGAERFDRFFANNSDAATRENMSVFVDPNSTLIIWAYNALLNANDINDSALIYDFVQEEASLAQFDCSLLGNFISPGFTVESLDTLNSSLDALTTSLDDNFYKSGAPIFGALQNNQLHTFTGPPLPATIDTSETRLGGDRRARVLNVSQAVEGNGNVVTIQLGTRNRLGVPVKYGPPRTLNVDGRYNERLDSRYQRFRAAITGDWSDATGVFVTANPTSQR